MNSFFELGRFINAFVKGIHMLSIRVAKLMARLPYLKETRSLLWLQNFLKNPHSNSFRIGGPTSVIQQYKFGANTAAYTEHVLNT